MVKSMAILIALGMVSVVYGGSGYDRCIRVAEGYLEDKEEACSQDYDDLSEKIHQKCREQEGYQASRDLCKSILGHGPLVAKSKCLEEVQEIRKDSKKYCTRRGKLFGGNGGGPGGGCSGPGC
ncbi:MAG: hypothetical protein OXB88_08380 [Bacteriovoracales bacterium]|nr:hypothetical protein [Bacteriovoracales bacterium]